MLIAIFRRRLRPGKTFTDFKQAWEAESGFGVPARVFTAVGLEDPSEILTIGFIDLEPAQLEAGFSRAAEQEHTRHVRIAEVIESTELRAFYELGSEHDFTADPREIEVGSGDSLLALLLTQRDDT